MGLLTTQSLPEVCTSLQTQGKGLKSRAQGALADLNPGPVNTNWVFSFIDVLQGVIAQLNALAATPGLNAYMTSNVPGYAGTATTDIAAVVANAQACITWIFNNFPTSGGFLLAESMDANGFRTPRSFTSANTAGLQTALNTLIASIP